MKLKIYRYLMSLMVVLGLVTGCAGANKVEDSYPKTKEEVQSERIGKLTGDGIVLFGGKKKSSSEGVVVNSYLWRASLDTIYFMPLTSIDPFAGTIITDWYKNDSSSKERYKLSIYIIGSELRSDAIRVMLFKQKLGANNIWNDIKVSNEMIQEVEDKILLRARELKYHAEK